MRPVSRGCCLLVGRSCFFCYYHIFKTILFLTQGSHIAGGFFTIWVTREAQEYWSGGLSLLQEIFLTQELNWGLLHCRWIFYQLSYHRSPWFGIKHNEKYVRTVRDHVLLQYGIYWRKMLTQRWLVPQSVLIEYLQHLSSSQQQQEVVTKLLQ